MVRPEIIDNVLHLHVEGGDKIWAFKSQLSIPLEHINGIRVDADIVAGWWRGIKFPGSRTYFENRPRAFKRNFRTRRTKRGEGMHMPFEPRFVLRSRK